MRLPAFLDITWTRRRSRDARRRVRHLIAAGGLVAGALLPACAPLAAFQSSSVRAATALPVRTAPVQRAAIAQTVPMSGEVRAKGQVSVVPKASGRVQHVYVDVGSAVNAGDALADLDAETPGLQLQQAQANAAAAEAKLAQVQAGGKEDDVAAAQLALQQQQVRLQQMQQGGRAEDVAAAGDALAAAQAKLQQMQQGGRPDAVAQAQAALDAANARLALLQKGATADVRQAAQSAADADTAALAAAQAAQAALGGSSAADLQQAQSQVDSLASQVQALQEAVASAEAAQANEGAANAADVQAAQSAYDTALAQRDAATAALANADKPLDVQVAIAKQALLQAQANRDAAQAASTGFDQGVPPVTSGTACQKAQAGSDDRVDATTCNAQKLAAASALQAAQQGVAVAQAQIDLLNNGGSPVTRAQLQAALTAAAAQVKTTQARLGVVQAGGYAAQRAQIEAQRAQSVAQLTAAQENLKAAQARLAAIKNGAIDAQRQAAQAQVTAAEQKLKADQARLDQLNAGPQDEELRQAQAAVQQAQAQLAIAQQPATDQDIAAQQALVDQAQQQANKARQPYTEFDVRQQQLAVQQAQTALHARQSPYTPQDVQAAQAAVDQAHAALALAEVAVRETKIVAPISGTVLDRQVSPGALVGPTTPMATIVPPDVEVMANADETLVARIAPGENVTLQTTALPGLTLNGTVAAIAPAIDPKTRTAVVRIDVQDPDGKLRPGMLAQVGVVTAAKQGALVVPRAAVSGSPAPGAQTTVATVDAGNRLHRQPVTIGVVAGDALEIASGLAEGQQVITGPTAGLNEGDTVNPVNSANGAGATR
jgi:RND family efflux transporter MFP subunit